MCILPYETTEDDKNEKESEGGLRYFADITRIEGEITSNEGKEKKQDQEKDTKGS